MKLLTLTPWERDFLLDRLDAGDVVASSMLTQFSTTDLTHDIAEGAVVVVTKLIEHGRNIGVDEMNRWEREALIDAFEGSTILARMADTTTPQKLGQAVARVRILRAKLIDAGFEVEMPPRT